MPCPRRMKNFKGSFRRGKSGDRLHNDSYRETLKISIHSGKTALPSAVEKDTLIKGLFLMHGVFKGIAENEIRIEKVVPRGQNLAGQERAE